MQYDSATLFLCHHVILGLQCQHLSATCDVVAVPLNPCTCVCLLLLQVPRKAAAAGTATGAEALQPSGEAEAVTVLTQLLKVPVQHAAKVCATCSA